MGKTAPEGVISRRPSRCKGSCPPGLRRTEKAEGLMFCSRLAVKAVHAATMTTGKPNQTSVKLDSGQPAACTTDFTATPAAAAKKAPSVRLNNAMSAKRQL